MKKVQQLLSEMYVSFAQCSVSYFPLYSSSTSLPVFCLPFPNPLTQLQNGLNNWRSDLGQEGINAVWDLFTTMGVGGDEDEDEDVVSRARFVEDQLTNKRFCYADPDVSLVTVVRAYLLTLPRY